MEGKIVKEMKTTTGRYILNRDNLPTGVYYLQIRKDDFIWLLSYWLMSY